ncbi:MAG: TetR/AcrR family transcriptional regulator [Sphingobium sp.]
MTQSAKGAAPASDLEDRIIAAAYACFEKFGIAKTTMEDIARGANASRQSVYRYFAGKDAIFDTICCREAVRINAAVRTRIRRDMDFAGIVTEALFIIITEGNNNPYLRQVVENPGLQSLASRPGSRFYQLNAEYWHELMRRALDRGELAADLSLHEIIGWLLMMQSVLQLRLADGLIDESELRRLIRRFTVAPLLAAPPPPPPSA